ncbi:MAG TPA: type II toxin-antitoxin system VapC family toxin [Pseudolabrys sp.]|nr:type II toxin-antitoxin system VapC family toxin [Pseudolabrys sp.]
MFLLDTNVISELRRPERAHPNVIKWSSGIAVTQFFMSGMSLLEIERGALQIARRDAAQGQILKTWIDSQILARFEGRILPVDSVVALRCARLRIPDPVSEGDALIAATALVHGMTVVTRNVRDFAKTGAEVFDPWSA